MSLDGKPKKGEVTKVRGLMMTIRESFVVEVEKYLKGLSMWQPNEGCQGATKPKQKPGHCW